MKLTFVYLYPAGAQMVLSWNEAEGVPIPILGDTIGGSPDGYGYPVRYRTFVYNGAQDLTIYFACGDNATAHLKKTL